jgi:hypothetical protein
MFTSTRTRREADKAQRRAAANRRIGHELAWWYYWQPKLTVAALLTAAAVGARWVWLNVEHDLIAGVGGGVGLVLLAAYLTWWLRQRSPYGGGGRYTRTSAMHFVGLAGALLIAAAITMWATGA